MSRRPRSRQVVLDEVELLEDEADVAVAQGRQVGVAESQMS
jgi:hypothetical protein